MKIGLYSPFLADNIGGGERYLLMVAECLLPKHQVDLIMPVIPQGIKDKLSRNFNLSLDKLNLVAGPFGSQFSGLERMKFTKNYDAFYYMTDGSFFISKAKRNIVHFMIPFNRTPGLIQRLKLNFWPVKVAISDFAKKSLERIWKIKINYVHGAVVDTKDFPALPKKNIILHVGRFFSPKGNKHCKKQDFLVKTFKKMCDQGLSGWQLILNGPVDKGQDNFNYLKQVKKLAKGYPIIFHNHSTFKQLQQYYGQAKIYWHATGFGIDEKINPQSVEHLGLSTIEAMSAGAVPVVINKGGQPEIVTHAVNGLLWETERDLIKQTLALIDSQSLWKKLSRQAIMHSREFSKSRFCQQTKEIFGL